MKKDKNNQNINSIPKYQWGNYFKKPIKWLAHQINDYGNSKHPFITTGTSYAYAIGDEKRKHPELTEQQIKENVDLRIKQNRKKLGLPTENTPSQAAAGLALGSIYYPWLAIPDIIFDTAASIDEPSTSNNLHTIADFPETVAKFTPSKIDDYVAKGVQTLGNIDDAVSTSGRNMFSNFDKKTGKLNNTTDKTSVRESTNIRYRKNGGQIRKMQTAAGGPIELYNTQWVDNWRNRLTSPVVVAKQLEKQTSKIPIKYLGGSKDNARKEFWKQEPVLQHAVDSVASQYRINPESLKYRLDKEGFTDRLIKRVNASVKQGTQRVHERGYKLLNDPNYGLAGTQIGLDDARTYIDSGKVKLINENWYEQGPFKNEKGRMTYPVNPVTLNDGIGIVAAHLKYFRDKAQQDFPNASEYDLDRYANAYYNRGALGGKKWVQAGAKGYNYRKKGGMLEFLKNGSGIHIKEKNKGKFTSYCGGKVTDECIRKAKASGNPTLVKRATFAQNSRRWKHEDGGEIKYSDPLRRIIKKHQTGGKTTFGQTIVNGALSLIKTSTDNKKIQADVEAQKAQNQADWAQIMKQIIKQNQQKRNQQYQQWVNDYQSGRTMDQPSQIVAQHTNYEQLNQELAEGKQELTNKNNQLDVQANAETSSNWGNAIGGILQSGLGVVGDYLSSKGTTPATTGSSVYKVDSFWTDPTLKTSTPTYSFNTPTLTPPKTNYNFLK